MHKRLQTWDKDRKVVIFASNCEEVTAIWKMCYAFMEDNAVYTDAKDCSLAFDVSVKFTPLIFI